jgi:hypothetical protein
MEWSPVSERRWQGTEKNADLDSFRKVKITNFLLWQIIVIRKYLADWMTQELFKEWKHSKNYGP